jgi:hypothetical protein
VLTSATAALLSLLAPAAGTLLALVTPLFVLAAVTLLVAGLKDK